jgi:hypothetical protein
VIGIDQDFIHKARANEVQVVGTPDPNNMAE